MLPADSEGVIEGIAGPLAIAGTEGLVVSYARCCFPIPNDPILASLSTGRGVVIHREACGNLASFRKQPEKWVSVAWQAATDRYFHVEIKAEVTNRMGVLASVALLVRSRQLRWAGKTVGLVATAWRARSMVTSLVSRVRKNSPAVQRVRTAGYSVEAGDGR